MGRIHPADFDGVAISMGDDGGEICGSHLLARRGIEPLGGKGDRAAVDHRRQQVCFIGKIEYRGKAAGLHPGEA